MKSLMVALGVAAVFICLDMTLAAMMGEECEMKSQCPDDDNVECKIYVGCDNGTCQCKTGYVADDQVCKRKKTYDQDCGDTDMCIAPATACTAGKCACPADHEWDSNKSNCFATATTYVAIGETCAAATDCSSRDTENPAAGYVCEQAEGAPDDSPTLCACADNYNHVEASDTCVMPKKAYNDAVCVVADNDCARTTVCRAVSADDTTLKCLCAEAAGDVPAQNWKSDTMECVAGNVDVAQDGVCVAGTDYCTGSLECVRCAAMTTGDMHCRAVDTDNGNGGGTSGAEQVIAGFVTLILSAVAMLF